MTGTRHRGGSVLRLPYRRPLAWDAMLAFLAPRATPGVEAVDGRTYRRTIELAGAHGTIAVRPAPDEPALLVHVSLPDPAADVGERVRRMFDLAADPLPIAAHLRRSPRLAGLVERAPGLRVPGAWDPFELAVRAVLGQQITVRGATTLAGRLVRSLGCPVEAGAPHLTHLFPRPERLAEADLCTLGLPRARAAAIRALARAVARRELVLDRRPGIDATVRRLCAIPGIGPWTAQYVALRALGEPDVFPAADLGVRRALGGLSPSAATRLAEPWRPWRSYAAMLLWTTIQGGGTS